MLGFNARSQGSQHSESYSCHPDLRERDGRISIAKMPRPIEDAALHLRSEPPIWSERFRATMSIFLGVLILAINTTIVFLYI
jgi:hypothetical protein